MIHCPTCHCGDSATKRAMSIYHVIAPCCGDVTVPKLIRNGLCAVCRYQFTKEDIHEEHHHSQQSGPVLELCRVG
jgi:hypothetical protein